MPSVRVVNLQNRTVGKLRRRGDGTFLASLCLQPLQSSKRDTLSPADQLATIEIGAETNILAKAMIKQIDRVISDLIRQVEQFRKHGGNPLCLAIVGVNFSEGYTSFEGARQWPTDGRKHKHPIKEAAEAVSRLEQHARSYFDEFLLLKFIATNVAPFPFSWVNEKQTVMEYSALLTRTSREYDRRFA